MLKKLIAVDMAYATRVAKQLGMSNFPIQESRDRVIQDEGVDVIEILVTVIQKVPREDSPEEIATAFINVQRAIVM